MPVAVLDDILKVFQQTLVKGNYWKVSLQWARASNRAAAKTAKDCERQCHSKSDSPTALKTVVGELKNETYMVSFRHLLHGSSFTICSGLLSRNIDSTLLFFEHHKAM